MRPDTVLSPEFRQNVGNLIYLTINRPNLSYLVGLISQFMSQPKTDNLQCAQRILRYISGIKDRALLYWLGVAEQLVGYTDVDWAGNVCDRKSTSGFAFLLGSAKTAWSSRK